ncbi:hypothetical protein EJ02DRAFT_505378 [Clathrospora elynae]|uniref:AAA+ ATPase domain-containing protein n=1 Tax=Clathrospora elynae TaxID=706981 RepID=A0A6A5SCZ1_9PLEO|nr:hypothetical protein EJ02DRAFT_505378 [Clathrospora elynae]
MALAAVQPAMPPDGKSVHPFFSKPSTVNETPLADSHDDPEYADTSPKGKGRRKRTRKVDAVKDKKEASSTNNQASLDMFTRAPRIQGASESTGCNVDALADTSLEVDPNHDRRKRRKTTPPMLSDEPPTSGVPQIGALDWHRKLQVEAERLMDTKEPPQASLDADTAMEDIMEEQEIAPRIAPHAPRPLADQEIVIISSDAVANEPKQATLKKQIKVTKSGKLLSSPPKSAPEPSASPKKRRGRKPAKAKVSPTVTVITYGTDAASRSTFGQRIEDILNGRKPIAARPATPKRVPSKPAGPPKVTHPFFLGKAQIDVPPAKVDAEKRPPTPRKSAVTPGKLRAETRRDRSPDAMPAFGMGSRHNRTGRPSGLNEASWPTRETAHVRNSDDSHPAQCFQHSTILELALKPRKLKSAVVTLAEDEELIARLAREFSQDAKRRKKQNVSEFEPPEDVRLPSRLLTTGTDLQHRVREQVMAQLPTPTIEGQCQRETHPAVADLFTGIEHTLTPFDEGTCESQTWTQKYSPKYASHVLQAGKEAVVLKDWLQSLTVLAVGGALKASIMLDAKKPPRKKRKKVLDDFIVSDDEDDVDEEMIALPDTEGTTSTQPRSFRRPQWTRNKNVVLISGPHGCGKSATVYAVAKELGFEVFEIHSGMRRSGKDIQDKVGDMAGNHLVNHKRNVASVQEETVQLADDRDDDRMDTALEEDISSGRQGTMTSFFQIKPTTATAKQKVKAKIVEAKNVPTPVAQAMLPVAQASQADILFDEDQQFWAQVTRMAFLSKRPIVITCNDERQIPMQQLPLAAILRLKSAPVDLATDYLLRQAISDLYASKNHDLRATITELNLWCQMSVGDRKGGLEWMYQRWPPGKDVDEQGRVLRVASEGTYTTGMGWLSHNIFETQRNAAFDKEEELLKDVWVDWGISPAAWRAPETNNEYRSGPQNVDQLARLEAYADMLSAADSHHKQPTDASQPLITDKARLSYTLAAPLLQADHCSDFLDLDTSIFTKTHLLVQRAYPGLSHQTVDTDTCKPRTETDYAKAILQFRDNQTSDNQLTRPDFATALDVLAAPPDQTPLERTSFNLTSSSFDRTFSIITLDLAPYVRSIVAHEQMLEEERFRMSNMLSGGGTGKRARTTRASRVALEGGVRETKRRDRWFDTDLDFALVMRTAGGAWAGMGWKNGKDGGTGEGAGIGVALLCPWVFGPQALLLQFSTFSTTFQASIFNKKPLRVHVYKGQAYEVLSHGEFIYHV